MLAKKINEVKEEKKSKIISFYSSKGGVGKTVLAANSAVVYGDVYKKKILVLDLDVQYGDVSILYNMHTEKTLLDIVDDNQYEKYSEILPYINRINEHVDVILAPRNPEGGEYISKDIVNKMIKILQSYYDLFNGLMFLYIHKSCVDKQRNCLQGDSSSNKEDSTKSLSHFS